MEKKGAQDALDMIAGMAAERAESDGGGVLFNLGPQKRETYFYFLRWGERGGEAWNAVVRSLAGV